MEVIGPFSTVPQVDVEADRFTSTGTEAEQLKLDFLRLLTTQLQHQDPLEPLENTEFTSQMAQFTSLGEQQRSNELLEQLLRSQGVNQLNQAVSYIGKQVVISGNQTAAEEGTATVRFQLAEAANVDINLYDSAGTVVNTLNAQNFPGGEQRFVIQNPALRDGMYTFSVVTNDAGGGQTAVATFESGRVTGVTNNASGATLELNGRPVALADVHRVEESNNG